MKRYPFVCKNCGAQFRLQAWKAECPSCGAEFTLEQVPEKQMKKGHLPALLSATALAGYIVYGFIWPSFFTVLTPLPPLLLQALTAVLAVFAAAGSFPALAAAALLGAGAAVFHGLFDGIHSLVGLLFGLVISLTSSVAIYRMRRFLKQTVKDVDARSMPEYSGWGSSKQSG